MTTQTPSSQLEVFSQTSGEQPTSPVMQQGAQFQQKLCVLLDAEDTARLQAKNKRTQELLRLIQQEVQKRSEEIGYDYEGEDYEQRLCISDEEFEEILREKVLIGNLLAYYTELTSIYGENPIILQKLLKEYYIEDLVYESTEKYEEEIYRINKEELTQRLEKQTSLNEYLNEIETLGRSGIKGVDFGCNYLGEHLGTEGMVKLVEALAKTGIKSVNFFSNNLGEHLGTEGMVKLVEALAKTGIKSVNIFFNNLGEHLGTEGMVKLVEALVKTGIKSVDFSWNNLGEHLGTEGMIQLVEALAKTGIRSVNLRGNYLGKHLGTEGMIQLAEALAKTGIKSVNFKDNDLGENLGTEGMVQLENKLKEYGIKYDISN